MTAPVLFVTGLGRCGTTLVMNMLRAAGTPVAGSPPAYEDIPVRPSGVDHDWIARQAGRAVKWIDPTVTHVDYRPAAAIFLTRDPHEQAKSQAKLHGITLSRAQRRALTNAVNRDTICAHVRVQRLLGPRSVLLMSFERLLDDPFNATVAIGAFVAAQGLPFTNAVAAVRVIQPRSPRCAPDLSIELNAMRSSHA